MLETDEIMQSQNMRSIGDVLQDLRKAEGLTFKQVVRGLNESEHTLRAIESGIVLPSREMDSRVAHMFERHEDLVAEYERVVAEARSLNVCAVKSA
ncbi:MAG: helix-turn-helix transcriptional regulator [bacterium]|nr:helix-turn-helix transcriptional regulator [bacterium]